MTGNLARLAGLFALVLALGGCGFHPLYGDIAASGGANQVFASIYIEPIEGEISGYELRNSLIDLLRSPNKAADAKYRLTVHITQTIQGIAIENDASITRYNYNLVAKYELTDRRTNAVVKDGTESTLSAYDVVASPYATLIAQHDAQKRGAHDIAYKIQVELAVFFSGRTGH